MAQKGPFEPPQGSGTTFDFFSFLTVFFGPSGLVVGWWLRLVVGWRLAVVGWGTGVTLCTQCTDLGVTGPVSGDFGPF